MKPPGASLPAGDLVEQALRLRALFDRGFTEPIRDAVTAHEDLLAIRAGGERYALRLADVAGLFADAPVTALSSAVTEFRGLAGLRGALVPVYDLGALLGHPAGPAGRWLALAASPTPVGLAFEALDGHRRIAPDAIVGAERPAGGRLHVRGVARLAQDVLPLIDVPAVLGAIETRARGSASRKEG